MSGLGSRRRWRHSLSGRLLGLFLITAVALVLVVRGGFHLAVGERWDQALQPHLEQYVLWLLAELGEPPDPQRARALSRRLPLVVELRGPGLAWHSGSAPLDRSRVRFRPWQGQRLGSAAVDFYRGRPLFRVQRGDVEVLLALPPVPQTGAWPLALVLTLAGVLLVLGLAWQGIRRLFQPLGPIRAGLARIGGGDLEHRIGLRRRDELGELAASVNTMAGDIQQLLEAKRQLLLAVSHELRSPLTRCRVQLALLPASAQRRAVEGELIAMAELIDGLVEGERLKGRHGVLRRRALDPVALVEEVLAERFPEARVIHQPTPALPWLALDGMRVALLVKNLVENALRYSPADSPPVVRQRLAGTDWLLEVADQGPGIAPQDLARLGEAFHRPDPSRSRRSGGWGLGLYLSRAVAQAHGGELTIDSRPGAGTTVRARLPVRAPRPQDHA